MGKGQSIAGLVCGITSLVICWFGYLSFAALPLAIVGLILSIVGGKKYKANGQDSLIDNRGKSKTFNEISDSQRLMAQIKLLEAQNKRLEMENDFLKKLEEIERRR